MLFKRKGRLPDQVEETLRAALMSNCPAPLMLGEFQMGLLPAGEAGSIAAHVAECPHCREELAQLSSFLDDADTDEAEEPDRYCEIRLDWGSPAKSGLSLAGVRGVAARARTFNAAHLWLAVTVQDGTDGSRNLMALVTRQDGYPLEHGTAWLSQENRLMMGGRIDCRGNLVITGLSPGTYDLGIQCDGTRVWITGVSV